MNPNQAGSFETGRREINWDAVPATFAAPNALPADFFNVNSPRGVVMSTPGSGFQVSGSSADAGTGQPALEFANLNAGYPTLFNAFSAQRLFTPVGSNQMDVTFFVPGTNIPAVTRAFGVVFSDVDQAGTTSMQFFDAAGNSFFGGAVSPTFPVTNGGFSFLGGFDNDSASIGRVRITFGNTVVGADEIGSTDIVVADDFVFGEPIAAPAPPTISDVVNQTGKDNVAVGPVAFTVNDLNTPAGQLALSATSSNSALIPNGNVTFGGSGANRTVVLNPIAGQTGTTTITLTVTDADGQTATDTFDVTITSSNTNPVISDVQNTTVPFGGFSNVVPFFVSDAESSAANLTVTAVSNNPTLVSNSGVVLGGSGTNRTFFIAPNAGQTGTATITLTVSDGNGGTASDTFDVTVAAPAVLPAPPTGVTVSEAAGANAGSIQSAVDAFRSLIGGGSTAAAAGSFGGIRREINWDGVPASKENPFPGDFFNSTSPRGVLLSASGSTLAVSGAVGTAGFEFGNLNATLPTEFSSFSSPKLFTALGTTAYDVTFRVPGTQIPA
ncbi:MAG: Ig-like domain-containing protein, partial [Gemmataceae bacterium]